MRFRVTVIDPACAAPAGVDVAVSASAAAVFADISADLGRLIGRTPDAWSVGTELLTDSSVVGTAPLLHGAVLTAGPPPVTPPSTGLLEARVTAGPDAGTVTRLGPGEHVLGRSGDCTVRVEDPDISRLHAVLSITAEGARVRDLGSTNGTSVDGRAVAEAGEQLRPGMLLRAGSSALTLALPESPSACVRDDGSGFLDVNRPPRPRPSSGEVRVRLPTPPRLREPQQLPVVTLVAPLVMGLVLAVALDPTYALFVLLSPVMLLGNFVSDRWTGRRRNRRLLAEHASELDRVTQHKDRAVAADTARRRHASPDASELSLIARGPSSRLWERRRADDDFLMVRLGTADLPSSVRIEVADLPATPTEVVPEAAAVVPFVPVTVSLRGVGVLGLAGALRRVQGLAAFVLAQPAALHSPRDLQLILLCPSESEGQAWSWVSWLPHVLPSAGQACETLVAFDEASVAARVGELLTMLDARVGAAPTQLSHGWRGPCSVVFLVAARHLRTVPGVARLLERGASLGIYFVCLETDATALPAECTATATVTDEQGSALELFVTGDEPVHAAIADTVSHRWSEAFGRRMAPLRDATPVESGNGLPGSVRLLDVLDTDAADAGDLARRWRTSVPATRAVLGVGSDGAFSVDLASDGPHVLLAGTTGSGKSELLQTLVASLAVANNPQDMSFVLVDYKGGSAFQDCARLPHTVGMVTDLDGQLTERALTSLGAELRRRELLLGQRGCVDIDDYLVTRRRAGGLPPLARLVLVVDEFATLAEELPDFVGGLVGIAQRGRSLGVHLVLATQRPAGVVSADIRANANLRIALRVIDPGDSTDVIETKDAAFISRTTPGRAFARTGTGAVVPFQSGRVGGAPPGGAVRATVRVCPWRSLGHPPTAPAETTSGELPTDLSRLVDAAVEAAHRMELSPLARPWLPPLAATVSLDDLPAPVGSSVALGLCDLPREQRQQVWSLDLHHGGHLLIAGGPRSGRTTVLRTAAAALAETFGPGEVHLYALDSPAGALQAAAALPHCGAVVARDETTRGDRLLRRLSEEVVRRQQLLARAGFSSIADQRSASPLEERLPWMVLLVDGWESLSTSFEAVDHGRPVETLLRLLREGEAAGLRALVTGDRSTLTGRLSAVMSQRLLLRFADPGDCSLSGIPPRLVPRDMPPGRGLRPDGAVETQVAILGPDPSGPAQHAALVDVASRVRATTGELSSWPRAQRPLRVEALPDHVGGESLGGRPPHGSPLWAALGLGGDELNTVGADLAADGPAFVVAGPAGSGRSTALHTLARSLLANGTQVVLVCPRRSALHHLAGRAGVHGPFGLREHHALLEVLESVTGPCVVICDDVERVSDGPIEALLVRMLTECDADDRALAVAGGATEMSTSYRGLIAESRKSRHGLLLSPEGGVDSDLLGTRVPRLDDRRPGRGVVVRSGTTTQVQVAQWTGEACGSGR